MATFHLSEGDGVVIQWVLSLFLVFAGTLVHAEPAWQADHSAPQFCLQNFNAYGPMYALNVFSRTEKWTAELQAKPACEVVHLQEVWRPNHINRVEHALSDRYRISSPNREARIGIMSLFKGEVRQTQTFSFNVNNEGGLLDGIREVFNVKKAFHVVTARVESLDEDMYFINTHLHPTSSSVRITQLIDLLNWRLQNQSHKMILSGDFNANFDTLEHTFVTSLLQVGDSLDLALGGYTSGTCTYCKENRLGWLSDDRVFDYVFFSNVGSATSELKVVDGKVNLRGTTKNPLSDHYGLRIQFALEPKPASIDFLTQELRRQKAINVLANAAKILREEKGAEFAPYKKELLFLVSQLQNHQGIFADYFSKSNY
jgi:endonuclease/exonuclease/phosphatase family metal-dependent hydrolase